MKLSRLHIYTVLLFCLTLFVRIYLIGFYKANSGGVDQNIIYGIQRLLKGVPLYQNPEIPPFAIMQYTPLYYHIIAGIGKLCGTTFADVQQIYIISRTFSLACNLITILLVALSIQRYLHNFTHSLIAALPSIMILTSHYFIRCDSLELLFFVGGIYCFLSYCYCGGIQWLLGAALAAAAAILSKQNGILLPLLICSYLAFFQKKWLSSFMFGTVTLIIFGITLYWLIEGNDFAFYQNAYLGLKNGFDLLYPVTIFTSQFYYDLIPCYFLGFICIYFFFRTTAHTGILQFLAFSLLLSFLFAVVTGLKIGSSNNYFTEFITILIIFIPCLAMQPAGDKRLFIIRKKPVTIKRYAQFCFIVLISSKTVGLFSSVFIERWFKEEKLLYSNAQELHHYFKDSLQLDASMHIYFTTREFLDNVFFDQSLLPTKDVSSQVYLHNPKTIDHHRFIAGMNKGLVDFIVADDEHGNLRHSDRDLPFVQFDSSRFQSIGRFKTYAIYRFRKPEVGETPRIPFTAQ